jgi:hypothetical protein
MQIPRLLMTVLFATMVLPLTAAEVTPEGAVRAWLLTQAQAPDGVAVMYRLGGGQPQDATLRVGADGRAEVEMQGVRARIDVARLTPDEVCTMASTVIRQAPVPEQVSWLVLAKRLGRQQEPRYRTLLDQVTLKDPAAVAAVATSPEQPAEQTTDAATPAGDSEALAGDTTVGKWRELILGKNGAIDWRQYAAVANRYHQQDMLNYRFGPRDEAGGKKGARAKGDDERPLVHQPYPDGVYKHNAGAWARLVPGPDGDGGIGGWIMSGQLLFVPDANAPVEYRAGCANAKAADGAGGPDNGICMRLGPQWTPDWWLRNGTATPTSPFIPVLAKLYPGLPLPPVAVARGMGGGNVTGFVAFQNGVIAAVGTGNDGYTSEGFSYPALQLPKGKVPTALMPTINNEFVLVTVWDVGERQGQVAVIAVENRINAQERQWLYGLPGWPTVKGLKLLGFIDLPFAAPMAIDVTVDTRLGNTRGHGDNANDDFSSQATRDRWLAAATGTIDFGELYWKQTAKHGYAIVSSRAENKVCLIDLAPLFAYYRTMYFTTQERHLITRKVGPKKDEWPHTFEHAAEQKPRVVFTWSVRQPTAVATNNRRNTFRAPRAPDPRVPLTTAYVATMDGVVNCYHVGALFTDTPTRPLSNQPIGSFKAGRNPTQIFHGFHSTSSDDLFVVSRLDRTITYTTYNGTVRGVLSDRRLVDPVSCFVTFNQCGFGGAGKGKTAYAYVLSVCDFFGRQVVNYMVDDGNDANGEQVPMLDADGKRVPFLFGASRSLPGFPFMINVEEVI